MVQFTTYVLCVNSKIAEQKLLRSKTSELLGYILKPDKCTCP